MHIATLSNTKEFELWPEKVNSLRQRYVNFCRGIRKASRMTHSLSMSIDGCVMNADKNRLCVESYSSQALYIMLHAGTQIPQNSIGCYSITWSGRKSTKLYPCKKNDQSFSVDINYCDYTEEEHFQNSTLHDIIEYNECINVLDKCYDLEHNTGIVVVNNCFFDSDVLDTLDYFLEGYDE